MQNFHFNSAANWYNVSHKREQEQWNKSDFEEEKKNSLWQTWRYLCIIESLSNKKVWMPINDVQTTNLAWIDKASEQITLITWVFNPKFIASSYVWTCIQRKVQK